MGDILFIVLRRLRAPLIALIVIYAVAIAGMVTIPGVDAQGRVWHVSFFHAFYVVSYTATTIGFGEIPYPFTDAQRLWVIVVIYLSVIGVCAGHCLCAVARSGFSCGRCAFIFRAARRAPE